MKMDKAMLRKIVAGASKLARKEAGASLVGGNPNAILPILTRALADVSPSDLALILCEISDEKE